MSASADDSLKDTVEVSPRDVSQRGVPAESSPTASFDFGAASHVGLRRPNNEDHFAIVQRTRARKILMTNVEMGGLTLPEDDAYAMIVADGMGGSQSGEVASELVLRVGWELAGSAPFWVMKYNPRLIEKIREKIGDYGRQIQQELRDCAAADPRLSGMGTTWTCVYVMGSDAIIAHVGDSRACLFRDGELRKLTRDHTFAQAMKDVGVSEQQSAQYKHLLINSFGTQSEDVKIDVDHIPLEDGDRLLVCSDGLTDMVKDDEISETLGHVSGAQAACDALVGRALQNGGKDNVTVIVADCRAASDLDRQRPA
jgi:serine/threonine protein phosphatase PrpC